MSQERIEALEERLANMETILIELCRLTGIMNYSQQPYPAFDPKQQTLIPREQRRFE